MWPTKTKVDWPYSEIGQKMANGQLLFCSLQLHIYNQYTELVDNSSFEVHKDGLVVASRKPYL